MATECVYIYIYVCMYVYAYIYICICICMYVYITYLVWGFRGKGILQPQNRVVHHHFHFYTHPAEVSTVTVRPLLDAITITHKIPFLFGANDPFTQDAMPIVKFLDLVCFLHWNKILW